MLVFKTLIETLGADEYLWMIPCLVMASSARFRPDAMDTDDKEWVSQGMRVGNTCGSALTNFPLYSCISFIFLHHLSCAISSHVVFLLNIWPFLSPPVHIARWAHMRHFLSVCHWIINPYLGKYYSYESETSPQYKAFVGASRKNTKHTLRSI